MKNRIDLDVENPKVSEGFRYIHNTNLTKKKIQEQKVNSSEITNKVLTTEKNEEKKYENKDNYKKIKLHDEHLESLNITDKEDFDDNKIYDKKDGRNQIKNYKTPYGNKESEIEKNQEKKNNLYNNYISKEKCHENIEKINDKINELLKKVFQAHNESNKKQYFSKLFQMRDINCIFSYMFFSLLIIFFLMNEYIGFLLSLLLLIMSIQLKFSRSYMTLLNSIVGVIIISIVTIFFIFNIESKNTNVQMPKNNELNESSNRELLILEAIICFIYAFILFSYMFIIKSIKKYKAQHLWIYHNIVNFFNLFDICILFCFGLLGFFFIFSCYGETLFIIMSVILFFSSLFTYYIRKYSNVTIIILQTILLIINSIIASASLSKSISWNLSEDDKSQGLYKIYLFYMVFLIFFFVVHLLYVYYVFFSYENSLSKWFSERKVYYSNVHPYINKDEKENNVYFKYDKYILSLDDHNKILDVQKTDSREINIDFKKYIYSDLHLYKHILLKTAIDIKYSPNKYDENESLKKGKNYNKNMYLSEEKNKTKNSKRYNNMSQKNIHYSNDFILDINESLSDISEIYDDINNTKNKNNYEQKNINKGLDFLLKKISTIHDEKSKNKFKVDYFKNRTFYFTNCKNTNYCTSSIFYSKYTYIIQVLLDIYDELIFYLCKKNIFTNLIESKKLEHENLNNQIVLYEDLKEEHTHKNLCLTKSNKISTYSVELGNSQSFNEICSLDKEKSESNMIKDIDISLEENDSNNIKENYKSELDELSIKDEDPDELKQRNESLNFNDCTNISNSFRKSNDSYSFYLLNSNLQNHNSLISNYNNDYIKIPIYSSSKLSFDENTNKEENCFWYYYPGIIARVYKEWLKCKNLDYKKFNNDFYFLFSNSNNLNEFLKSNISNIEKDDEIKLFDISQVLSSNKNIINKINNSCSSKRPSFLSEDLHSNSLNGIISNFLTDRNANFDALRFLNSKTLQSFFEDNNIKQFLSSLYNNKKELMDEEKSSKEIKNLTLGLDKKILQNEVDHDSKSRDTINIGYLSESNDENTDRITQKDDNQKKNYKVLSNRNNSKNIDEGNVDSNIEKIMKCNNMQNNEKDKNDENANLNDLLNYAETLIMENKKNDTNKKNLINNSIDSLSYIAELDAKNMNSFDEILSNFIKNLQIEKDNMDSEENKNDYKEKDSLKTKDESHSNINKNLYEENQLNLLTRNEDTLNNQINIPSNMKIIEINKEVEDFIKRKDIKKEKYIEELNFKELKENNIDSNNKLGKTDEEKVVEKHASVYGEKGIKDEKNELSETYKHQINKEFMDKVDVLSKISENSSEHLEKKNCRYSNELSFDSLNKYINNDLKNEKNKIKRELLININSSCSSNIDGNNKRNMLGSSIIHNKDNKYEKEDIKSIQKNILEFSNNGKINNLVKRNISNNNFENFSSYYITERDSSNMNEELILLNVNNTLNKENTKNKYCHIKKIEDNSINKEKCEKNFNLSNISGINLKKNMGDNNNNDLDIENKLEENEKINTQDIKSKVYNDEVKEKIFMSQQNQINYNLINDSIVFSKRNISNTKKLIDKEEESNITRELSLEMIDNFKKKLHDKSMKRLNNKGNVHLNEKKIKKKKENGTEEKQEENFHREEENKNKNCKSENSSIYSNKNNSRNETSVEKYYIHSNDINYSSNNELSYFNDEKNKNDNYDDDDYENDFGYNSEYIKLIEEKSNYANNFSDSLINNSCNPESFDMIENLKKYLSSKLNKKEFENNNFSNISLLEYINKYLENNKGYSINIFNELIFDANKKKDENLSNLPINICKTKENKEESNEKLNNKSYIDKVREKITEYYDISGENKHLKYDDKNLNIHLSSNSYEEPIINFLNTYIFENNNRLMKNAILKTKHSDKLKLKGVNSNGELNVLSEYSYNKNENKKNNINNNSNKEEKNQDQENNILKGTFLKKKSDIKNSYGKTTDKQFPYGNFNNSSYDKLVNKNEQSNIDYNEYEEGIKENKYNYEHTNGSSKKNTEVYLKEKIYNFEDNKNKINDEDIDCKEDNKKNNNERICENYYCINGFESLNKNETCIKYFCELKNKFKDSKDYPEEKIIKKADLKLIINNDSSYESFKRNENYINKEDNKYINDKNLLHNEKQNNICTSNKNIFNNIYGFQNSKSESSSSTDNNLTGLLIGSDIFYESFVYKSLGDIENLKRRINEFKKKESKNKENKELNEHKSFLIEDIVEDHLQVRKNTNEEELTHNKGLVSIDFKDNNDKINNNNNNYNNEEEMNHKKEKYDGCNSITKSGEPVKMLYSNYSIDSQKKNINNEIKNKYDFSQKKNLNNSYIIKDINNEKNNEKIKSENHIYDEKNHIKYNSLNKETSDKKSEVSNDENQLKDNSMDNEFYKNYKFHKYSNKENHTNSDYCSEKSDLQNENDNKENFKISVNGEILNISSNKTNVYDSNNNNNNNINNSSNNGNTNINSNYKKKSVFNNNFNKEENNTDDFNNINISEENDNSNEKILTYYQTEENVVKCKECNEDKNNNEFKKYKDTGKEIIYDTPIPSSNANEYLIHKNVYNEKSSNDIRDISSNSIFVDNNSSFINKNSSDSEKSLLNVFLKGSNISKLSNNLKTEELKIAYKDAYNNLYEQYQQKTESNNNSEECNMKHNNNKSKKKHIFLQKEIKTKNKMKKRNKSMSNTRITLTTTTVDNLEDSDYIGNSLNIKSFKTSNFLKKNRYDQLNEKKEKDEEKKKKNRYHDKKDQIFYNSEYIQHFNTILNTYSWSPDKLYIKKNNFLLKKSNTYLDVASTEDSGASDMSNFVKDALDENSISNKSSNNYRNLKRNKKKWKSENNLEYFLKAQKRNKYIKKFRSTDILKNQEKETKESFVELIQEGHIFPSIKIKNKKTFSFLDGNKSSFTENENVFKQNKQKLEINDYENYSNMYEHILNSSVNTYLCKESNSEKGPSNASNRSINANDKNILIKNIYDEYNQEYTREKDCEINGAINESNEESSMNNKNINLKISKRLSNYLLNRNNNNKDKNIKLNDYIYSNDLFRNEIYKDNNCLSFPSINQSAKSNDEIIANPCLTNFSKSSKEINILSTSEKNDIYDIKKNSKFHSEMIGSNKIIDSNYELKNYLTNNQDRYNSSSIISINEGHFLNKEKSNNNFPKYDAIYINSNFSFESKYNEKISKKHKTSKKVETETLTENNVKKIAENSTHNKEIKTFNSKKFNENKNITNDKKNTLTDNKNGRNNLKCGIDNDKKKKIVEELKKKFLRENKLSENEEKNLTKKNSEEKPNEIDRKKKIPRKKINIDQKKLTDAIQNFKNYKKMNEINNKKNKVNIKKKNMDKLYNNTSIKFPYSLDNFCNVINSDEEINNNVFINKSK
ncbi:conserved Plasmodium protein, unknown function [Plasmodium gallinaceum]|uniref:Uncharacterized protein n=1 Tax=Plasmodium gallinaceum TaxID=5849 RepID=A0A1J1H0C0_PLAGA|nr:conserved Plasmodium protein, unknown function [Plasmodium gallinaceum]CRG98011.1 conserved Plasmodium protein, unknown function [Plasmodium gallinaceum]